MKILLLVMYCITFDSDTTELMFTMARYCKKVKMDLKELSYQQQ